MTSVRAPDLWAEVELFARFQTRELHVGHSCELCHSKRPSRKWKVSFDVLTNCPSQTSQSSQAESTFYESWIWFEHWSSFEQLNRRSSLFSEGDTITILSGSKVIAKGIIKKVRTI